MNPQIKAIAEKAGLYVEDQMPGGFPNEELLVAENFANLLIQECADICFNLKFTAEGPSDAAEYQRTLCGMSIKENFGLLSKGPITAKNVK